MPEETPHPPKSVYRGFGVSGVKTVFQHEACFSQLSSDFLTVKYGLSGIPKFTFRPIGIILTQEATCSSCWRTVDVYMNVRLLFSVIWSRIEADFLIPLKFRTIRNYSEAYAAGETLLKIRPCPGLCCDIRRYLTCKLKTLVTQSRYFFIIAKCRAGDTSINVYCLCSSNLSTTHNESILKNVSLCS